MRQATQAGSHDAEVESVLRRLDQLARVMDEAFPIPGTRRRIGFDGIVGLLPVIGDGLTAVIALYPVVQAYRYGAPVSLIVRMLANIGVDTTVGAVPFLGDLFDMAFKVNRRNVELLRRHFAGSGRGAAPGSGSLRQEDVDHHHLANT